MTGRYIGLVIALCIGAWVVDMVPSWSVAAVVGALYAGWVLLALDHKREKERRHRPLGPVKGRRR